MDKIARRTNLFPAFTKLNLAAYKYKWTKECDQLLPEHYKKRCLEFTTREPIPVHWRPDPRRWKQDPHTNKMIRVQNIPIEVLYPDQCNEGLWGGEGIVQGFIQKDKRGKPRVPKLWTPFLLRRPLYSEILDRWLMFVVTHRTLDLIDDASGLDYYILKTHERDLNSKLGIDMKRLLLTTLAKKSLYPDDPVKRSKVLEKYKEFIIPLHEAEWVGLSISQALAKAKHHQQQQNKVQPEKYNFTKEIFKTLEENPDKTLTLTPKTTKKKKSLLERMNPLK